MTRIGVVSDVHNNAEALRYALAHLRGCDGVLSLGDLVSQYRASPEVIALVRDAGVLGILGNHEKWVLHPAGERVQRTLSPDDLAYLRTLPARRAVEVDGRRILAVHGAPWDHDADDWSTYVYAHDQALLKRIRESDADVVLMGHTHLAMAVRSGAVLAFNPGSCGEARDRERRLSYGVLDFTAGTATVYQVVPGGEPRPFLEAAL